MPRLKSLRGLIKAGLIRAEDNSRVDRG